MKALVKHMTHLNFCDYSICLNGFKLMRDITVFAFRVEFGKSLHFAMRRGIEDGTELSPYLGDKGLDDCVLKFS